MAESQIYRVFHSLRHPNGRGKAAVVSTALGKPIGVCMLPVMITALIAMLQGAPVLTYLYVGFPIALAVSSAWVWIRVRSVVCELHLGDTSVALRSLVDAADPPSLLKWQLVLDISSNNDGLRLTLGLEEFELIASDWEEWGDLTAALHAARTVSRFLDSAESRSL